jgi:RNA-directed DNA polymerase
VSGKRQKTNQLQLAFMSEGRGESPASGMGGTEPPAANRITESPADTESLMEAVCNRENLQKALKQVLGNKGSAGIDGMTVNQLPGYLARQWPAIREQLLQGAYQPQAVKRVEIPKPDGGVRKLGIPTVVDRFIQQAVMQVLQGQWDRTFSQHSYGFRPGRSAHQAVAAAQQHIADGCRWVVDIDLEKFFDRVNHDRLMASAAKRVRDKRLLRLIRAFLNAGVMENGLVSPTDEGTPQGGPLSPLLSNLVLDELDRELEKRGHRFVRYADDCNIYVRSERAGRRVMEGIEQFISRKLKLKVNAAKSAVARPWERKFLGFTFTGKGQPKRLIARKSLSRFKQKVREITRRTRGISVQAVVEQLAPYLRGWRSYFGFCQSPSTLRDLGSWVRRRLRCFQWKQWKRARRRFAELVKLGVTRQWARITAGTTHGPWRTSRSQVLSLAMPTAFWERLGLPPLLIAR